MKRKDIIYRMAIAVCALAIVLFCGRTSAQTRAYEKELARHEICCNMAESLEAYVLDVVFETDIFDDITSEEQEWLDEIWDDENPGPYYVELIRLYGKYYGNL